MNIRNKLLLNDKLDNINVSTNKNFTASSTHSTNTDTISNDETTKKEKLNQFNNVQVKNTNQNNISVTHSTISETYSNVNEESRKEIISIKEQKVDCSINSNAKTSIADTMRHEHSCENAEKVTNNDTNTLETDSRKRKLDKNKIDWTRAEYSRKLTNDVKRDHYLKYLFKKFTSGSSDYIKETASPESISEIIEGIEQECWKTYMNDQNNLAGYQNQIRAICMNVGDTKNLDFNNDIYDGVISMNTIATMKSIDMASNEKKAEREKLKKLATEEVQSDWELRNIKRGEGQFMCSKCRKNNTTYFQVQTRSSDEPMSTFVNCLDCGKRWKF